MAFHVFYRLLLLVQLSTVHVAGFSDSAGPYGVTRAPVVHSSNPLANAISFHHAVDNHFREGHPNSVLNMISSRFTYESCSHQPMNAVGFTNYLSANRGAAHPFEARADKNFVIYKMGMDGHVIEAMLQMGPGGSAKLMRAQNLHC